MGRRLWECLECGRGFATTKAAEKATRNGCPGCGGVDIDLATRKKAPPLELFEVGADLPLFAKEV